MRHRNGITGILIVLLVSLAGCGMKSQGTEAVSQKRFSVKEAEKPESNPLKGWAPWSSVKESDYPASMAFVLTTWKELEPREGVFDFDAWEENKNMDFWRKKGARLILRIVCDYPAEEAHADIPDWLYERTGEDGSWYECGYGKGYSPNYENPEFIEAHERLLKALGERYGNDLQIAFIELGSLGHWGEWHVDEKAVGRLFPSQEITDVYVKQYQEAFPEKKLLLRRPYEIGIEGGFGLYNDAYGQREPHEEWLQWIENGYVSSETGETLSGMPDFWKYGPSGGEFGSGRLIWDYATKDYKETYELLIKSHTTFIGPRCFAGEEAEYSGIGVFREREANRNIAAMSKDMGYCFSVTGGEILEREPGSDIQVSLDWLNSGIAPIYENWPLFLALANENGEIVWENQYDLGITEWLPGERTISIPLMESGTLPAGHYTLQAAILDPLTGKPGIRLANEGEVSDCLYAITEFEKSERSVP